MRWKYAKLLGNLANALDATTDRGDGFADIADAARAEGRQVLAAARIEPMNPDVVTGRRGRQVETAPVEGHTRSGSSSWQTLARGTGSIEADYLNGEIALLGRMHGVPTPVNLTLQWLARAEAEAANGPGRLAVADVRAAIARA
ncbi:MAG: ketopantoate reductase family protein [Mycobacteriales bacterium]